MTNSLDSNLNERRLLHPLSNSAWADFQFLLSTGRSTVVLPLDGSPEKWQNFIGLKGSAPVQSLQLLKALYDKGFSMLKGMGAPVAMQYPGGLSVCFGLCELDFDSTPTVVMSSADFFRLVRELRSFLFFLSR